MTQRVALLPVLFLVFLYAGFMVATNHRLTILDDEATIITVANSPVSATLHTFFSGNGQHEHPPLSDLFLHGWLILTHRSFAWLRIFAIAFYITGLLILAPCGNMLGGIRAYWATLLFGLLWPFGYFYARITGWYCFCFMLVALLTYTYLRLLQLPSRRNWTIFTLTGILLLWSNYYAVALLALLLLDLLVLRRKEIRSLLPAILISAATLIISFLPLLRALLYDANVTVKPPNPALSVSLLKGGYILFALLASVAVAPWFLWWSVPIAIAALLLLAILLRESSSRRFTIYFLLLIAGLGFSNHLDLKRLLFITPWLMLAIALAASSTSRLRATTALTSLSVIFLLGWFGIATGWHRGTVNFYEPWKEVAATTSRDALRGQPILSDSGLYFFYLNYAFGLEDQPAKSSYLGAAAYSSKGVTAFRDTFPASYQPSGKIIVVEGVDTVKKLKNFTVALAHLRQTCTLTAAEHSTPDPAIQFKGMLDRSIPLLAWRVSVDHFDCSANRH